MEHLGFVGSTKTSTGNTCGSLTRTAELVDIQRAPVAWKTSRFLWGGAVESHNLNAPDVKVGFRKKNSFSNRFQQNKTQINPRFGDFFAFRTPSTARTSDPQLRQVVFLTVFQHVSLFPMDFIPMVNHPDLKSLDLGSLCS